MSYAVYHSEKGKTSSAVIGKHIDRAEGAEYTYKHADPELRHLNKSFELNDYCKMPVQEAVQKRISAGYNAKDKKTGELKTIRKDAVKYNTHILTGSHERMKEIEKNPKQLDEWITANRFFLEQEFGRDNIVRFVIHRDEKTPHLHAITVNLTEDGRLSAKEIIGNKKEMQLRQDRYAEMMEPFELKRGIRSTGISHEGAREYYARMKETIEPDKELTVFYKPKGMIDKLFIKPTDINISLTLEKTQNALKTTKIQLNEAEKNKRRLAILEDNAKKEIQNAQNTQLNALQARKRANDEKEKASRITLTQQRYETMQRELGEIKEKYSTIEKKYDFVKKYEGLEVGPLFIKEATRVYEIIEENAVKKIFGKVKSLEFDDFEELSSMVKKELSKSELNFYDSTEKLLRKEVEKENYQFEEKTRRQGFGMGR